MVISYAHFCFLPRLFCQLCQKAKKEGCPNGVTLFSVLLKFNYVPLTLVVTAAVVITDRGAILYSIVPEVEIHGGISIIPCIRAIHKEH